MLNHLREIGKRVPALLAPEDFPDRLIVRPVDMWAGDADAGARLCDGVFKVLGQTLELHGENWEPVTASAAWVNHLHGFSWLRDLRACGGAAARQQAQALIESWIAHYQKPKSFGWRSDLMGERLSAWISHHDFFATEDSARFEDTFFASLSRQAHYLAMELQRQRVSDMLEVSDLRAVKGLLYAGLSLEGRGDWIRQALEQLQAVFKVQILADGMHVSRSPYQALQALKVCLEMRSALQAGGQAVPEFLQDVIGGLVPVVRFFRYGDRHFGGFHGTVCGDLAYVDSILAQAAARSKRITSLPDGGYEKAVLGRSLLMLDCGGRSRHYAPLSFEMAHGKDRIFVNCGSHQLDEGWRDVLAGPAAHNGLMIGTDVPQGRYRVSDIKREDGEGFCYMQASHDGFLGSYGVMHQRSLYIAEDGCDLRGEDRLIAMSEGAGPLEPKVVSVRFHIHPRVLVSVTQDGRSVLLRLPGGVGWRFQQVGGYRLRLEDSVYAGDLGEVPRKSQQLVVESAIARDQEDLSIKWALRREGV